MILLLINEIGNQGAFSEGLTPKVKKSAQTQIRGGTELEKF